MPKILVIDDERMIRDAVSAYFAKQGYEVLSAETGAEGLKLFEDGGADCVILDLMLPDISGEAVCRRVREVSEAPVIMLTAKNLEADLLNGFSLGADDYVTKPFSLKELGARVTAVLHRWLGRDKQGGQTLGRLTIDAERRAVAKDGVPVELTPAEWSILLIMLRHPQKVFTREELIDAAFGMAYDGYDRAIDTHIKNLRKKLEDDPRSPVFIQTVYGVGYRLGGGAK